MPFWQKSFRKSIWFQISRAKQSPHQSLPACHIWNVYSRQVFEHHSHSLQHFYSNFRVKTRHFFDLQFSTIFSVKRCVFFLWHHQHFSQGSVGGWGQHHQRVWKFLSFESQIYGYHRSFFRQTSNSLYLETHEWKLIRNILWVKCNDRFSIEHQHPVYPSSFEGLTDLETVLR